MTVNCIGSPKADVMNATMSPDGLQARACPEPSGLVAPVDLIYLWAWRRRGHAAGSKKATIELHRH